MRRKKFTYILITLLLGSLLVLLLGEVIARTFGVTVVYEYDAALGWRPRPNFTAEISVQDQSGGSYLANYNTNRHGFRAFGDLDSDKPRILFIGDSWTGDPNTSDDDAYFSIVGQNLPVEVFAIGGGGYGTLQELMLLRKFSERIQPDIFVLQYSDNDLINNSFALEGPRITRNQKYFRPYRVNGETIYRLPPDSPYILLHRVSRLFRTLDALLTTAQYKIYDGYYPPPHEAYDGLVPAHSPEQQAEIATYRAEAITTTRALMAEMNRALPPTTKLLTFTASSDDPNELAIWQTLAEQTGFTAYPSVSQKVETAETAGEIVRVADGAHWNRLGNRIAGEELSHLLAEEMTLLQGRH